MSAYYIKHRTGQSKKWDFVLNEGMSGWLRFGKFDEAMDAVREFRKYATKNQLYDWEYKVEQQERPKNVTEKDKLHIPQIWNEEYAEWEDWTLDGGEGAWFCGLKEAKEWIKDHLEMSDHYETTKTRIKTFDLTNQRVTYKKNG